VVMRRFDTDPNVTPFLRALEALRREALRQEGFPEHVATIIAMIDQYAESAMGDRHYFCKLNPREVPTCGGTRGKAQ
jgi:hypothetical protein